MFMTTASFHGYYSFFADIIQSESNCKCNTSGSNDVTNDNSPRTAGHLLMGVQPDKTGTNSLFVI